MHGMMALSICVSLAGPERALCGPGRPDYYDYISQLRSHKEVKLLITFALKCFLKDS